MSFVDLSHDFADGMPGYTLPPLAFTPAEAPPIVHIRVAARATRWVRERQHYAFIEEAPDPDGDGVIMTYRPDAAAELTP